MQKFVDILFHPSHIVFYYKYKAYKVILWVLAFFCFVCGLRNRTAPEQPGKYQEQGKEPGCTHQNRIFIFHCHPAPFPSLLHTVYSSGAGTTASCPDML